MPTITATLEGYERLLSDYTKHFVQEYERSKRIKDAVAAVTAPPDLTVT